MRLLNLAGSLCRAFFMAIAVLGAAFLYVSSSNANSDKTVVASDVEPDELAQWGLPLAVGREEVEIYCNACHSVRLVAQQGLTRSDWDELFDWMVEEQEMEEMPAEDRKLVLNYLSKYRGIGRKLKIK